MIADDFYGTLDTASQFSKIGHTTRRLSLRQKELPQVDGGFLLFVSISESRPPQPSEAYARVYALSAGAMARRGLDFLTKKRGLALGANVGSELQAWADA